MPQCGHRQVLGTCAGYAECMDAIKDFREADFLRAARTAREGRPPLAPARPWCDRWSCMDHAACALPFKVYQYTRADLANHPLLSCLQTTNLSHAQIARHVTHEPKRACAFWFEVGQRCRNLPHASTLPYWRGNGINHVFIDHWDRGIDAAERAQWLGRAAIAQGHATAERWVHGLDIALGLHPRMPLSPSDLRLAATPPWARRYLLTFKGTHSHISRVRAGMHHDLARRVVLATFPHPMQCMVSTSLRRPYAMSKERRLSPLHADCCQRLKVFYEGYEYRRLMNTTFALVMPGRQPASYRLAEVLGRGSIPVFYGFDDALLPYDELIDWSALSLNVPIDVSFERTLLPLLEAAAADRPRMARMQREGQRVFRRWFGTRSATAGDHAILETLRRRFELEVRRRRLRSN